VRLAFVKVQAPDAWYRQRWQATKETEATGSWESTGWDRRAVQAPVESVGWAGPQAEIRRRGDGGHCCAPMVACHGGSWGIGLSGAGSGSASKRALCDG
jgi:hypothetical protein